MSEVYIKERGRLLWSSISIPGFQDLGSAGLGRGAEPAGARQGARMQSFMSCICKTLPQQLYDLPLTLTRSPLKPRKPHLHTHPAPSRSRHLAISPLTVLIDVCFQNPNPNSHSEARALSIQAKFWDDTAGFWGRPSGPQYIHPFCLHDSRP